ncbi:MAG: FtsW/RodA/SpoVE family cell cycle protein, partial [Candidatus Margulisbacteria bacterium]|nr:FtsW/RodA/SpoVE family cell cycle protein [Candidatus Margulisiibacteriota bacterium]
TGIPLPFISYGGTSMIINLFSVGLLLNISKRGSDKA